MAMKPYTVVCVSDDESRFLIGNVTAMFSMSGLTLGVEEQP